MRSPLLMIPGPTNLDPQVLEALSWPSIGHTSPEFHEEFNELLYLTAKLYKTKKENVIVYSGSGTLGMEGAVASLIEPDDKVLALITGYFGERFAEIAEIYGAKVKRLVYPSGHDVNPEDVKEALEKDEYKAILVTHIETTNGVYNRVEEVAKVARRYGVLIFVDVVSSLGGAPFYFDNDGYDVAFAGSQKCIAAPPGATLIAISDRAKEFLENRRTEIKSYYFNLKRWLKVMENPRIYLATPTIPILRATRIALKLLHKEGLENRWRRHEQMAKLVRKGLTELGLELKARRSSPTITVAKLGKPIAEKLQEYVLKKHNVLISTGIGGESKDVIRIGHMGIVNREMVELTLSAIEDALKNLN
ncbi:hypothetical protein DRN86_03465 [Candidatus Geothermarchaeota archaeon]|nr:MAG: hypothetical protein DRN86_03465 [Candidatus Geothermarchaeota archaeon]